MKRNSVCLSIAFCSLFFFLTEVERPARQVEIHALVLESWEPPDLFLTVACSAGTYIRSLAHDLGERLGPGAHLASLVRTRSGSFKLEEAISLTQAENMAREGRLGELIVPLRVALADFPDVTLDPREVHDVSQGRWLSREIAPAEPDALCCAYNAAGELVALMRFDATSRRWRPHKVFVEPR